MSDTDEIDAIRQQKREQLEAQVTDNATETTGQPSPTEPVYADGVDHFDDLLGSHRLVLVDFYADWCGPCKMLEPTVAELAAETPAAVVKVDVDAHQDLAAQYQVQGIPTLILFVDGAPVERIVGVRGKDEFTSLISKHAD